MNLYVYTLGCRVNQCESEAIAFSFSQNGWKVCDNYENASLIIVNTCTVTGKAEQKARRMIRLFAKICPVIVTGCYAQLEPEEILSLSNNVFAVSLKDKSRLLLLPEHLKNEDSLLHDTKLFFSKEGNAQTSLFDYAPVKMSYHCRSYLKIQDGCDNNCAFCRVHIARGKSQSLDEEIVIKRALELEKQGYHEIVLTGVNLTMYNHEAGGLGSLMKNLLVNLGPDIRLRLSSLEADHIDNSLLDAMADSRVQPYFHIPVQSAAEKVMKRINRAYDKKHLEDVVGKLRQIKDDPLLACDIITGLPAEGEAEFEETVDFLKSNGFSLFHVFPFSPRPGTALENAKDKVEERVRDFRAQKLRSLSAELYAQYEKRQTGKILEAITEGKSCGTWHALTGNYLKVRLTGPGTEKLALGDLVKVKITESGQGHIV